MQFLVRRSVSRLCGHSFTRRAGAAALASSLFFGFAGTAPSLHAQAISVNGGSIQGTITDAAGGVLPGASITIKSVETDVTRTLKTDSAGFYSVGPLNPGNYTVDVVSNGFEKLDVKTVVRTGTATSGNFKLIVGSSNETVQVNAGQIQVNTDQPGVSDVITREQIEALPINGRNFLDIAQLQPGVILQSGSTFDPTKAGYSAISVGGVSGRTTRILLDGQDITDETVGTTIMNVDEGAVDEFQLNRSTQDVSGEVTSTGQVLVATRSGGNVFHGETFYNFQDNNAGFARTTGGFNAPFQRNQFGGSVGGPILKDKLFFFGNLERIKQDQQSSATTSPTFVGVQTQFPFVPSPYRETYSTIRLDYDAPKGVHLFVRGAYNVNSTFSNFQQLYSLYQSRNNVPAIVGGADFVTGHLTHSFRGGYEKFHNLLVDGTAGQTSVYNPSIQLGAPITLYDAADNFFAGPNYLAPQGTYQSDKQLRYDGTWTKGTHTVKYGASMNRLLGGGFANFYGPALFASFNSSKLLSHCNADGISAPCPSDPLSGYSIAHYTLGNNNGFFSEQPGFGLSGGGLHDWRSGAYVADSWKVSPSFTAIAGLRWSADTDRANQDLPTPLCSSLAPSLQFAGCTGNTPLFDQYQAGLGAKTHQPYGNFGPQAGFVFSPSDHKTSVRGGIGIFYESDVFNNTSNARSSVVNANGNYFNDARVCGGTNQFTIPGGGTVTQIGGKSIASICAEPILQSAPQINQLKAQYQIASQTGGPNPGYIGGTGGGLFANGIYGSQYLTPYSIQFNGGIQRELAKGTVLTVDYVHNATIKIPLVIDVNHVGAARYLNKAAAQAAIATTLKACGASSIATAAAPGGCPGGSGMDSTGTPNNSATIVDFAANGLDSLTQYTGGQAVSNFGAPQAAFGGINPNVGEGRFILPVGRSGYDALQIVFRQQVSHPAPGILSGNIQISYSLSEIVNPINGSLSGSNSGDQFFNASPYDNDDPNKFLGRSNLDHTNELSFGGSVSVKYGLNVGVIGHFYSAPATSLTLDNSSGNAGEIFRTDVDGDGTTGDLVPGTGPGAYMHEVKGSGLNTLIGSYNGTSAGRPTPAGQALIDQGLLTSSELAALGAVQQPVALAPTTPINNPAFRAFDLSAGYPIHLNRLREGLSLLPQVVMYNVTNLSNFTGGSNGSGLTGLLLNTADAGGAIGTAQANNYLNGPNNLSVANGIRTQRGSGTFDQGAPRTTEFQLKLNF